MRISGLFALLAGIALSMSMSGALAADFDKDPEAKEWKEVEVPLPAFPEKQNLIPFRVGAVTDKQFFVDGKSISVGSDEVIRFSLVIVSSSGAQNISFEGMRCATGERRFYAFGQSDGTWSRARSSRWERIVGGSNRHHSVLYSDYFCSVGVRAIGTPEDARRVLIYGR